MRSRSRCSFVACALSSALFASSAPAQTPPTSPSRLRSLRVHRTAAAEDCPDAPALAKAVGTQLGRPALEPVESDASASIEIEIDRPGSYSASIRIGDRTRAITDAGSTCAGLEDALALTLAITLDEAPPPPADAATRPRAPENVPPHAPVGTPAREPPPVPRARAIASGGVSTGLVETSATFQAAAAFRVAPRISAGLGALWIPARSIPLGPGEVSVSLAAATVSGCYTGFRTLSGIRGEACSTVDVGEVRGSGTGYATNSGSTRPWGAVGLGAALDAPIAGPFDWSASVSGVLPFVRQRFAIADVGVAYDPAPVGLLLAVGVGASAW